MKLKHILLLFIAIFSFGIYAQQGKNFSMWYLNNSQINPASVGDIDHDIKLFTNYRNQYFTAVDKPFQTISGSVEAKLKRRNSTRLNYFGLGANFTNDRSGDGVYSVNNIKIPIAYHIFLSKNSSLTIGAAPGLYNRNIQGGDYTWESQWNGYEFIPDNTSNRFIGKKVMRFDIDAGLTFKHRYMKHNYFFFGVSGNHLSQPYINFENDEERLYTRYIGQFGMRHRFKNNSFGISPNVIAVFQGPNRNIIFGTNFDFYLQDPSRKTIFVTPTHFSFGVYHRLQEGMIVNAQVYFKGFRIAVAYDSNLNTMLNSTKSVGGFELALSYDIITNKRSKYLY